MTVRRWQMRSMSSTIDRLTKPLFSRRGFQDPALINQWETLAGSVLARHTSPEKITYPDGHRRDGTLHLIIDSSSLAIELQHLEPQLLERVNTFFGYRAVARLKITQGVIKERRRITPKDRPPLSEDEARKLEQRTISIEDDDLRSALKSLGETIMSDKSRD